MSKFTKELLLLLFLFLIAAGLQFFAGSLRMALCFYFLPTLYSAYHFDRRHATLTAFACVALVVLLNFFNSMVPGHRVLVLPYENLFDMAVWGGVLIVTSYAMGTLYERKQAMMSDIRESFSSLLLVLQHSLANEKYSQDDSYRVSVFATKIAEAMDLGSDRIEAVRSAALLRDLSKLGISNDILYKAADVSRADVIASFGKRGAQSDPRAQNMGGNLRRVLPIIVAQQILAEQGARAVNVPIEAHILAVADAYQKLTSGKDGNKFSPQQAEEMILAAADTKYNCGVVDAFIKAFGQRTQGAGAGD
ncbi:MAG: hypothetical protein WCC22_06325 [Terriglobales bacterium]